MDGKIKTNGHGTLDQRIAAVLVSDEFDRAELASFIEEAEAAIIEAQATIETESANALDISNGDPDSSDALVRKAERTVARLNQALPLLRDRLRSIEAFEYAEQWNADVDVLESERDRLADELRQFYPFIVERLANLFARIDQNNEAIGALHADAPSVAWGETPRRLLDAELVARDLTTYDAAHPPLRNNLKLPDFDLSRDIAYPVQIDWNQRASLMAAAQAKQLADKFAVSHSQDWAAARELAVAEEEAEAAKKSEELKAAEAASFDAYQRRQREDELRRRAGKEHVNHE